MGRRSHPPVWKPCRFIMVVNHFMIEARQEHVAIIGGSFQVSTSSKDRVQMRGGEEEGQVPVQGSSALVLRPCFVPAFFRGLGGTDPHTLSPKKFLFADPSHKNAARVGGGRFFGVAASWRVQNARVG
jgi:hypothetical protein